MLQLNDEEIVGFSRPINGLLRERLDGPLTPEILQKCKILHLCGLEGTLTTGKFKAQDTSNPSIVLPKRSSDGKSRFFKVSPANSA